MVPLPTSRDPEILDLIRAGDDDGLSQLLDIYGGRVFGALRKEFRVSLDVPSIEDALSQATANVWRSIHTFDATKGSLATWFHRIARNCALHIIQRELKHAPTSLLVEVAAALEAKSPEVASGHRTLLKQVVHEKIRELPQMQRRVLEADLAAGGTADTSDLAEEFGSTKNSISSSRSQGRKRLKELLEDSGILSDLFGKKKGVS